MTTIIPPVTSATNPAGAVSSALNNTTEIASKAGQHARTEHRADRRSRQHASKQRNNPTRLQPPRRTARRHRHSCLRIEHDHGFPRHIGNQPGRLGFERTGRQHRNRQQFHDVSAALDNATAESGPAQSDGYQSIHPAARRIRRRRAADEDERHVEHAGVSAAERTNDASALARRRDRGRERQHRATGQRSSDLVADGDPARDGDGYDHGAIRPDRLYRHGRGQSGSQPFTWNGVGSDGTTWPAGNYTLTATAVTASGQSTTVTSQVEGQITSVDLTQTPPLLAMGGQNYKLTDIQRIVVPGG